MDEKIVKDSQGLAKDLVNDTISRQAAITAIQNAYCDTEGGEDKCAVWKNVGLTNALHIMQDLPPAQPECAKDFVMLKVIDLNGRPYYSIIYLENGNEFEGYSSYDLKVISEYLKRYFGFAQPDSLVRPSARWMSVGHKSARICSRCFRDEPYKFADHDADVYDFCPHCGADMRGEADE